MKKIFQIGALSISLISFASFAHHPAADRVDEDVYEMISAAVADTPHADMTFDSVDYGSSVMTVTARGAEVLNNLVDEGLMNYASMLDGNVNVSIDFQRGSNVTVRISQTPN